MASKCVGEEEVGRIFAIFSLISATSSSLVYAAFQAIYRDLANSDRGSKFWIVYIGNLFLLLNSLSVDTRVEN